MRNSLSTLLYQKPTYHIDTQSPRRAALKCQDVPMSTLMRRENKLSLVLRFLKSLRFCPWGGPKAAKATQACALLGRGCMLASASCGAVSRSAGAYVLLLLTMDSALDSPQMLAPAGGVDSEDTRRSSILYHDCEPLSSADLMSSPHSARRRLQPPWSGSCSCASPSCVDHFLSSPSPVAARAVEPLPPSPSQPQAGNSGGAASSGVAGDSLHERLLALRSRGVTLAQIASEWKQLPGTDQASETDQALESRKRAARESTARGNRSSDEARYEVCTAPSALAASRSGISENGQPHTMPKCKCSIKIPGRESEAMPCHMEAFRRFSGDEAARLEWEQGLSTWELGFNQHVRSFMQLGQHDRGRHLFAILFNS
jgi:hypothetical protein